MRWTKYNGARIPSSGHRTSIELAPTIRFGPTTRRYGCVWREGEMFAAYVEDLRPGQIEDRDLGKFASSAEARRAVEQALEAKSQP